MYSGVLQISPTHYVPDAPGTLLMQAATLAEECEAVLVYLYYCASVTWQFDQAVSQQFTLRDMNRRNRTVGKCTDCTGDGAGLVIVIHFMTYNQEN